MSSQIVAVENPWTRLPHSAPFALHDDLPLLQTFNARAKPEHRVDTSLLPEPFLGRHDAPVVLLNLNPGWKAADAACHANPAFAGLSRANLEQARSPYPFYLLNPALESLGTRWWRRKLRWLIDDAGLDAVTNNVLCVEYFPYHSHRYGSRVPRLPSQEFSFGLVRSAIEREALIVIMRSARRWEAAVPELEVYGRRLDLINFQNPCVSPRNCPDGYGEIVAAIRSSA